MHKISGAIAAIALAATGTASAANTCPEGHVCASDPATVVQGLQDAGFKAQFGTDGAGDPKIESSASGYSFAIYFYNCTDNADCGSLQFQIVFEDDGTNTPELANEWNKTKRFTQMSAQDSGSMMLTYDVTTVGGLNQENFADAVDWWQLMLSQVRTFFSNQ